MLDMLSSPEVSLRRHEDLSTVVCAPVYNQVLGLTTEVVLGADDGLPHASAIRCDFLMLMFKAKLTQFVATLSPAKTAQLYRLARPGAAMLPVPAAEVDRAVSR